MKNNFCLSTMHILNRGVDWQQWCGMFVAGQCEWHDESNREVDKSNIVVCVTHERVASCE